MSTPSHTTLTRSPGSRRPRSPASTVTNTFLAILPLLNIVVAQHVVSLYHLRILRRRIYDSRLTGEMKLSEWLRRHPAAMHAHLGVDPAVFVLVLRDLEILGGLASTRDISSRIQLAIFLYICKEGVGVRHAGECFQRSLHTVSKAFKAVVCAFTSPSYYYHWVRMPTTQRPHPANLMRDSRFNPWFKDCMGAIDGTFIPCRVPVADHPRYRSRKKTITMNVLACCTFDLRFCYVLAGWEGTANDHRVYREALASDLVIPEWLFFLGDAGYSPTAGTFTPYRGVRYHLREWGRANQKPQNPSELFNLRHSSARNVIERIFGVVKNKFKILDRGCWFDIHIQAAVVLSLCALHNTLREYRDSELDVPEPFPSD